jgi:hypothetical protein
MESVMYSLISFVELHINFLKEVFWVRKDRRERFTAYAMFLAIPVMVCIDFMKGREIIANSSDYLLLFILWPLATYVVVDDYLKYLKEHREHKEI